MPRGKKSDNKEVKNDKPKKELKRKAKDEVQDEEEKEETTNNGAKDKKTEADGESDGEETQKKGKTKGAKPKVDKTLSQQKITEVFQTVKQASVELGDGKIPVKTIKISSWNVNGLKSIMGKGEVVSYLKKEQPDIFCINETKCSLDQVKNDTNLKQIHPDYTHYYNCCKNKDGYSGTAILTKYKPLSVKFDIGIKKHDEEGRTITLEFEQFYIVSCYVPNAGQKLDRLDYRVKEWDKDFSAYLTGLRTKKATILTGDLNVAYEEIDIANPEGSKRLAGFTVQERESFGTFLKLGWIDTFRQLYPKQVKYSFYPARSKAGNGWRLDYFVVNSEAMKACKDSRILDNVGSDHKPIELDLDLSQL